MCIRDRIDTSWETKLDLALLIISWGYFLYWTTKIEPSVSLPIMDASLKPTTGGVSIKTKSYLDLRLLINSLFFLDLKLLKKLEVIFQMVRIED